MDACRGAELRDLTRGSVQVFRHRANEFTATKTQSRPPATPAGPVRAGGLRVVVAVNSFARRRKKAPSYASPRPPFPPRPRRAPRLDRRAFMRPQAACPASAPVPGAAVGADAGRASAVRG